MNEYISFLSDYEMNFKGLQALFEESYNLFNFTAAKSHSKTTQCKATNSKLSVCGK